MNSQVIYVANSGIIILGGGLCKHHICNANMMVRTLNFYEFFNKKFS